MIKKIFYIVIMLLLSINVANAKIWTLDANPGNTGVDFKTIQAAHDGASAGDTIYVIGSAQTVGNATFTKKLIIIGSGYFLTENNNLQANPISAKFGNLTFNAGSEGSVITGCEIQKTISINVSNIWIVKNYIHYIYRDIELNRNIGNIYIQQNFINADNNFGINGIYSNSSNIGPIYITNNYINSNSNSYSPILLSTSTNAIIENNIIIGGVNIYNSTFQNNILISGTISGTGNGIFNNIGDSNQFPNSNGNLPNTDTSTVFIGTGSSDGKYQLKTNSPAKGAGIGGVDIGMYGGINPYVLSGIPAIPSIYFFTAPFSGSKSQGLQVHIKAKTNN